MRTWILFSLLFFSLVGCMRGYDESIDYRNNFVQKLKSFEYKRSQLRSSFTLVFENIEAKLQTPNPNFRNIASEWNSRLSALKHRIDELQNDLVRMDTLSNFFYRQLRQMNKLMDNKTVREREKAMNDVHEKEWRLLRASAKRNIIRARNALKIGHDAYKVLVSSAVRTKRETALKTMREVRHALFQAIRRLERFSHATELLLSLEDERLIPREIEKMETRRKEVVRKLDNIAQKMEKRLKGKNINLQEISWEWESKYADMYYDLEALADDFDNIKSHTQVFFDKSAYHIAKIATPAMRDEELKTQKAHQAKLDKLYEHIEHLKKEIGENLTFGEDAYQVLINAARRKQTDDALEQLTAIRAKLRASLIDLQDANEELKEIFSGIKRPSTGNKDTKKGKSTKTDKQETKKTEIKTDKQEKTDVKKEAEKKIDEKKTEQSTPAENVQTKENTP